MADLEAQLGFDPTLKKKKKKKKKVLASFDDDEQGAAAVAEPVAASAAGAEDDEGAAAEEAPATAGAGDSGADAAVSEDFLNLLLSGDVDFSKLKKRKAKRTHAEAAAPGDDAASLDFTAKKKKKSKKKKELAALDGEAGTSEDGTAAATPTSADASSAQTASTAESTTDGVYDYSQLLERVFTIMRENNPELASGEKRRFTMKPPQVVRLGAKKTGFVNFTEICKLLHRQQDHVLAYFFSELGTSGSVDSSNCLVIKGRFQPKQIESVLRRYIREYVTCHTCRSPNTILAKYSRLYFLQCETCGSRCSVASIKSGFQAVTGSRRRMRANQQ
jgi:translation initiation factor 2 subunit 2